MKTRCYNAACKCFKHYGGKGIKVCPEWHSFEAFQSWALHSGYSEKLLIDRIKGDKNYCPENCRWATKQQQACNRSGGKLHYKGASKFGERWRARITVSGKIISLGLYDSEEAAACAYDAAAKEYHGEFARPNFQ